MRWQITCMGEEQGGADKMAQRQVHRRCPRTAFAVVPLKTAQVIEGQASTLLTYRTPLTLYNREQNIPFPSPDQATRPDGCPALGLNTADARTTFVCKFQQLSTKRSWNDDAAAWNGGLERRPEPLTDNSDCTLKNVCSSGATSGLDDGQP